MKASTLATIKMFTRHFTKPSVIFRLCGVVFLIIGLDLAGLDLSQLKRPEQWGVCLALCGAVLLVLSWVFWGPRSAKFRQIECSELKVVGEDGKVKVWLSPIDLDKWHNYHGHESVVFIGHGDHGGKVEVWDSNKDCSRVIWLGAGKHGGTLKVYGESFGMATLGIDEHGNGEVYICDNTRHRLASIHTNEDGDGAVSTWDRHGDRQ